MPNYEGDDYNIDKYSKCVYEDSQCLRKKKPCSEITEESVCNKQIFDNTLCTFKNDKCNEIYKTCEAYNSYAKKTSDGCKATIEHYDNSGINYSYKCVYEDSTCKSQKLTKCENYEPGQDEEYCYQIKLNKDYKECVIKDNSCVEQYKSCPGTNEELTRDQCEAIKLSSIYHICKYDDTKKDCYRKQRECSDYEGSDRATCESIILYDNINPEDQGIDLKNKCVLEKNVCTKKPKVCSDAKNAYECSKIIPSDNKKCFFLNGKCEEKYEDCDAYNNSEENID